MDKSGLSSLSQGVFVVPFQHDKGATSISKAGPSRNHRLSKKLQKLYERECRRVQGAKKAFEQGQINTQLDDIRDWLDSCDCPPLLSFSSRTSRLKIAILQSSSLDVSAHLLGLTSLTHTLHGRDVMDLAGAVRDIATGLSGGAIVYTQPSGTAGLDALGGYMKKQKKFSHLLLHIAQAQALPQNVLSELLYILSRHPSLSLRVILSVPSASLFISSVRHVDPTALDISVVRPSGTRRRNGAVATLTKALRDNTGPPFLVSHELLEELQVHADQTGGGQPAAAKALKWLSLRASQASRLGTAVDEDDCAALQAAVDAAQVLDDIGILSDLLDQEASAALEASLNPAPRVSILQGLSDHQLFLKIAEGLDVNQNASDSLENIISDPSGLAGLGNKAGNLRELQILFELYASAGRTVNLWDWLQGFGDSVARTGVTGANGVAANGEDAVDDQISPSLKRKRPSDVDDTDDQGENGHHEGHGDEEESQAVDEIEQDRLHSTFIRFCEEARMMGLLRARGRGKADEVVKGIGFV